MRTRSNSAWLAALVACLLALFVVACGDDEEEGQPAAGGGTETTQQNATPTDVSFGTFEIPGFAATFFAEDQGYFTEENVNVELVPTRVPADAIPNLVGNKQQFAGLNLGTIAAAAAQNVPLRILSPTYYGGEDSGLWTNADSGISSIEDLKGKKIGVVGLKSPAHAAILELVEDAGMKADDVEIVLQPIAEAPAALRAKRVDAAQITEPLATAQGDSIAKIVPNIFASFGEEAPLGYYVTTEKYASENPEVVAGVKRALDKGLEYAAANEDAVRTLATERFKAPAEAAQSMPLPPYGVDLKIDNAQQQVEILKKHGFLAGDVDMQSLVISD